MTNDNRGWIERIAGLPDGEQAERVRCTRTSIGSAGRQAISHESLDGTFGPIGESLVWEENHAGSTVNRSGFQDLIAFCEANPRPHDDPGFIEMDSPCRFGHLLDGNSKTDLAAYASTFIRLEKAGWRFRFVSLRLTGNPMVDYALTALHSFGLDQRISEGHAKMKASGMMSVRKAGKAEA